MIAPFNSFAITNQYDYEESIIQKIKAEIKTHSKEYILQIDEHDFKNYLIDKYTLEPLVLDKSSEQIPAPSRSHKNLLAALRDRHLSERQFYKFFISYNFKGTPELFKVKPNPCVITSEQIVVGDHTVSFHLEMEGQDAEEFKRLKNEIFKKAFANIDNVNSFASSWNLRLNELVEGIFTNAKSRYLKENEFFRAINLKVDPFTESIFSAPVIKKKEAPKLKTANGKEFSSEPILSYEMYEHVLKVIYDFGKSMERKPSTYMGKDEEGLRDQYLLILETRYDDITATGETFNRGGKTDILLKYAKDGSNLFVAECKFWHGASHFLDAVSQLFDRYLTWRDSKAALMIFVTNKDFSSVLKTIQQVVLEHPYCNSQKGQRGESSFSFLFNLAQDKNKHVYFEVMAFHFDKIVDP